MAPALSLFDPLLAGLWLATAWVALREGPLLRAVVAYLLFGTLTAAIWLRLGATDLALAEAVIGTGATGVLLLLLAGELRAGGGDG